MIYPEIERSIVCLEDLVGSVRFVPTLAQLALYDTRTGEIFLIKERRGINVEKKQDAE